MRFLKHAGVTTRYVVCLDAQRGTGSPTKQRVLVSLDIRLIVSLTRGRPEQDEPSTKATTGPIVLLGEKIHCPHWDSLEGLG